MLPRGRMEERRSSSTSEKARSTTEGLLAFPVLRADESRRSLSRAERLFNVFSVLVLLLFASGWSWSIAMARSSEGSDALGATPATAAIANGLTDGSAPSAAYLTGAMLDAL